MPLDGETKLYLAAVAKYEVMTPDQRTRFVALCQERVPMAVGVLEAVDDGHEWPDDMLEYLETMRMKQQVKKTTES